METNNSARNRTTPTNLFTEKSEKSQYRLHTANDIPIFTDEISSTKYTVTNHSEKNLRTRESTGKKKAKDIINKGSFLTQNSVSPKKKLSHSKSFHTKKKTITSPNRLVTLGPVRTQTYSPINSSKILFTQQKYGSPTPTDFDPGSFFYQSPGGSRQINFGNSSVKIMQKVFDQDYSLHSPSKKKARENEFYESFRQTDESQQSTQFLNHTMVSKRPEIDSDILNNAYKTFLEMLHRDPSMKNASISSYIQRSLTYLNHPDFDFKLGALINLFDMIYHNKPNIEEGQLTQVCVEILSIIPEYRELEDTYLLTCSLEILAIVSTKDVLYDNIDFITDIIMDERVYKVKEKAIQILTNLDYPGFYSLINVTNKDFNELPLDILNHLAQVPEIQAKVIVPSLLSAINSSDPKKKNSSLAALNRMYGMIKHGGGLPVLIGLLNQGNIDKELLASCILASGSNGEQILLKILKTTTNPKIKQAICKVLPWRISEFNQSAVKIQIVPYQVSEHYQCNPGTMCVYHGSLKPLSQIHITGEGGKGAVDDYIQINSRDFLASLQRFLSTKYQEFTQNDQQAQAQIENMEEFKNYNQYNQLTLSDFLKNHDKTDAEPDQDLGNISPETIKTLMAVFEDKNPDVRESVVHALGLIGLPEAVEAIETLNKALYDPEGQIRALGAWALGKLGDTVSQKVAAKLVELLKDKFWKVRTSACIALGYMGEAIKPSPYPILLKILKEGTINKVVVCETLIRLGLQGEQLLIEILKTAPTTDYLLKSAIIQSFELADVDRSEIDFVIEELFRNAADEMVQVRKACLATLEKLRQKAQSNNITYLKSRNILPLFYYFLQDVDLEIRMMALQSIYQFGPQGELMLIEGIAKEKNPIIRAECAKGLGMYGPRTFRVLLFGLRDPEENVRRATSQVLINSFSAESVISTFSEKHHQKPGLIYSIGGILNQKYSLTEAIRKYLEEILNYFQNETSVSRSIEETKLNQSLQRDKLEFITITENEEQHTREQQQQQQQPAAVARPRFIDRVRTSDSISLSPSPSNAGH